MCVCHTGTARRNDQWLRRRWWCRGLLLFYTVHQRLCHMEFWSPRVPPIALIIIINPIRYPNKHFSIFLQNISRLILRDEYILIIYIRNVADHVLDLKWCVCVLFVHDSIEKKTLSKNSASVVTIARCSRWKIPSSLWLRTDRFVKGLEKKKIEKSHNNAIPW